MFIPVTMQNILLGYCHRYEVPSAGALNVPAKILNVYIEPETENKKKIVYECEGPETRGKIPANINFIVQYVEHTDIKIENERLSRESKKFSCFPLKDFLMIICYQI